MARDREQNEKILRDVVESLCTERDTLKKQRDALLEAAENIITLCVTMNPDKKCGWCNKKNHADAPFCPILRFEKAIEGAVE